MALEMTVVPGPREMALVVFERVTGEIERVLRDVGCAYGDTAGTLFVPGRLNGGPDASVGLAIGRAIEAVIADPRGRFALLDLRCGAGGALAARSLSGLPRRPERLLDDPIGLVEWLSLLHETRAAHPMLAAYLGCSDPDEILPFLPYHPKGEGLALEGVDLLVSDASIVTAVEVLLGDSKYPTGQRLVLLGREAIHLGAS